MIMQHSECMSFIYSYNINEDFSLYLQGAIAGGVISLMFYLWMALGNIVVSPPSVETKLAPAPLDMCFLNSSLVSYFEPYNISSYNADVSKPDQSSMQVHPLCAHIVRFFNVMQPDLKFTFLYILITSIFHTSVNGFNISCYHCRDGFNQIYGMSFQWFDFIAIILVFVVGLITSKIVGTLCFAFSSISIPFSVFSLYQSAFSLRVAQ